MFLLAEIDGFRNMLFVTVVKDSEISVVAIDIASGKQSLLQQVGSLSSPYAPGKV